MFSLFTSLVFLLGTGTTPTSDGGAGSDPTESNPRQVDMIELNHYIDEDGREVFRQLVFYDWSPRHKQFHVRAWRLIKKPSQLPQRRWVPSQYETKWIENGTVRIVQSKTMQETWTRRDPERVNRQLLPEDKRVPLWSKSATQRRLR